MRRDEPGAETLERRQRVHTFMECRDAGASLTEDALRDAVTPAALVAVASETSAFVDEALRMVGERHAPVLECREGCAYCCRKPGVLVSIPELLRVLAYVRTTLAPSELAQLRARAAGYAAQMQGRHFNDAVSDSVPCPLLVDERCTVY